MKIRYAGVLLITAACSGGAATATSAPTTTTDPGPPITTVVPEFSGGWSPAWAPERVDGFDDALLATGLWLPVPLDPPSDDIGVLDIEVSVYRRVPVGPPGADLIARRPDGTVFVSLQTIALEEDPICDRHLDESQYPAWATIEIRGVTGCAWLSTDQISSLEWTERGQNFHADFTSTVALDDLIDWLDRWERTGA